MEGPPRVPRVRLSVSAQGRKLGVKESDWRLPGTTGSPRVSRTRFGGDGRANLSRTDDDRHDISIEEEELLESSEEEAEEEEEDAEDEDLGSAVDKKKPDATRVILEVKSVIDAIEKHGRCLDCEGPIEASMNTLCIATNLSFACMDSKCGYVYHSEAPAVAGQGHKALDNRRRSNDFAINVLFVLGFISCGDGGAEAARMLGLLGLPNDTTMETRSFQLIEGRISSTIWKLTEEILLENLTEEVKATVDPVDFVLWQQSLKEDATFDLPKDKYPKINVSFDMGWQQRSSGNRYASPSGHAILAGGSSRKPVAMCVKSKLCNCCSSWNKKPNIEGLPCPIHTCLRNHDGSSSSMEPAACLDMTIDLYRNKNCIVKLMCADDDASTRALLRWSNADYMKNNNTTQPPKVAVTRGPNKGVKMQPRPDKGKLPGDITEPSFVADPNHRRKVLHGELVVLAAAKKDAKATMTRMDATRIAKNYGYFIRTLPDLQEHEYEVRARAVLEHHFDNHEFCGDFCRRRKMTEDELVNGERYYRCHEKDAELYKILVKIVSRFVTFDRLQEVAHGMDTQVNESFNNTASWLAPKNKMYCGTVSLTNRISIGLGIVSLGLLQYFRRLYHALGIAMTPNIVHFLEVKDKQRSKRLSTMKTNKAKRDRMKRKYLQLQEDEKIAKKERSKRDGTYKTGMNMAAGAADGYTEDDLLRAAARPPTRGRNNIVCPLCGLKGHSTKRSKKCLQNPARGTAGAAPPAASRAVAALTNDVADDLDRFDGMQLQDDPPSDPEDLMEFFDAGTWNSDDDDDSGEDRYAIL